MYSTGKKEVIKKKKENCSIVNYDRSSNKENKRLLTFGKLISLHITQCEVYFIDLNGGESKYRHCFNH